MRKLGVVGDPGRLEAHVRVLADIRRERHAVLESEADGDRKGVHDPSEGRTLLGDLHEHLSRTTVVVLADRHIAFAVGHPERERARPAPAWKSLSHCSDDHVCTVAAPRREPSRVARSGQQARDHVPRRRDPGGARSPVVSFFVVESG